MREEELKQRRQELDVQWELLMQDGLNGIDQFMMGCLMEEYNRIDEELLKITYKLDQE